MKNSEFLSSEPLLLQIIDYLADVGVDTDCLVDDFVRAIALAEVDTDVGRILILSRQLPERIFDYDRRIAADAQFQIDNVLVPVLLNEGVIPLSRLVPALVLDEFIVASKIHCHWLAANGTARDQLGRDCHIFLLFNHRNDSVIVVVGFVVTRHGALEQAVVALCIEQTLLVKARRLELVVDIRREDKVVLILDELQEVIVHRLRRLYIAVEKDMSAPPRPECFLIGERIESARIHIGNAVLLGKVGKVFVETLAGICQPCGGGQTSARADNNRVGVI